MTGITRRTALATLVAGTLDILSCVYALTAGRTPVRMPKGIATALPGDGATAGGPDVALVGLVIHFAIMAAMAAFFIVAATRISCPGPNGSSPVSFMASRSGR